jgi:hypothetical protein
MASSHPAAYIGATAAGTVKAEWDGERCRLRVLGVVDEE